MPLQNTLTREDIIKKVAEHPAGKVKVAITDIDGILRGKYIHKEKFLSAVESGIQFCNVVFGWDANDLVYEGINYTGWHTGYPDATACIDIDTFREVPWDRGVPFFLADFSNTDGTGLEVCPRNLLKKVIRKAEEMGFKPFFSQEFEWFNFLESPDELNDKGHIRPTPITPGMFGYSILRASRNNAYFNDLFDLLAQFRVPIEGIHTETGPGVYETAILYSDILEAADRATLFKTSVKEIGMLHHIIPTFMAKWHDQLPGCSGHVHQSLWDHTGKTNLFFDAKDPHKTSKLLKSYLAGQLHCLPKTLPLYAPNINSYKRLVEGAWAPTTITWGIDNRTTAIRVIPGNAKSTRIEFRVTGSDVNPYLAMAANLMSGLYGIENNLDLTIEASQGNGYEDKRNGTLSRTLEEATKVMKNSELAVELFGEVFVKHFTDTRDWEWKQHLKAVTDWELRRYFEII